MSFLSYENVVIRWEGGSAVPDIRIEKPKLSPKGDYSCSLFMHGFGHSFEKEIFGVSPQQALSIAMKFVRYLIINSSEFEQGRVFCRLADNSEVELAPVMLGEQADDIHPS